MQHRSISQRLKKAKSIEVRREILRDWSAAWQREQMELIGQLEQAIKHDDYDALCIATGQLKAVSQKKFEALPRVIETLTVNYEND